MLATLEVQMKVQLLSRITFNTASECQGLFTNSGEPTQQMVFIVEGRLGRGRVLNKALQGL